MVRRIVIIAVVFSVTASKKLYFILFHGEFLVDRLESSKNVIDFDRSHGVSMLFL